MSGGRPRGLDALFAPRGVAVIGASRNPAKVGYSVLKNLLYGGGPEERRERGFQGQIVPVSISSDEVLGVPTCRSVDEIEGPIDLAIFAIPAPGVPAAMDVVARRGVQAAIVLAAGFVETGAEGRRLEAQVRSVAQNTGMRVVGPNCTGIYSGRSQLQASFFSVAPFPGASTLISQSGSLAQALVQYSHVEAIGLRHVVSLGEKVDVEDAELIRYFARDEETRVLGLYIESLDDPRAFHWAARDAAPKQAIVVLRGGHTGAGHRAAKVHEGILATSETTMEGALLHPGIYRASTLAGFLAALRALAYQPPARGRRIAIVTNAGGAGVLAADAVSAAGLDVVKFTPHTAERLAAIGRNPRAAVNPIDLLGDAKADRFMAALEVVSTADEVDAILLVLTDQAMTDPMEVAVAVCEYARRITKPIVASFVGLAGQQSESYVETHGIPEYDFPELAVEGLKALVARGNYLWRLNRGKFQPTKRARVFKKRW